MFGSGLPILGGSLRPAIGGSVNTQGYTSKAYADLRWEVDLPSRLFLGLGLGAALHDGNLGPTEIDRKAPGARVLPSHSAGTRPPGSTPGKACRCTSEHTSNAGTARYNEGMDGIGLRYGYRF